MQAGSATKLSVGVITCPFEVVSPIRSSSVAVTAKVPGPIWLVLPGVPADDLKVFEAVLPLVTPFASSVCVPCRDSAPAPGS